MARLRATVRHIQTLQSDDPEACLRAIRLLRRQGPKALPAAERLLHWLRVGDERHQEQAFLTLRSIGSDVLPIVQHNAAACKKSNDTLDLIWLSRLKRLLQQLPESDSSQYVNFDSRLTHYIHPLTSPAAKGIGFPNATNLIREDRVFTGPYGRSNLGLSLNPCIVVPAKHANRSIYSCLVQYLLLILAICGLLAWVLFVWPRGTTEITCGRILFLILYGGSFFIFLNSSRFPFWLGFFCLSAVLDYVAGMTFARKMMLIPASFNYFLDRF